MSQCYDIERLHLGQNQIANFDFLEYMNFPSITSLNVSENQIASIDAISMLG
jgi:Leucine-rich repeat (LRR) protein